MIQQRPCPNCGEGQTLNMGAGINFCMMCRFNWQFSEAVTTPEPRDAEVETTHFSRAEWRRLEVYRRAVAAGYYSDWS